MKLAWLAVLASSLVGCAQAVEVERDEGAQVEGALASPTTESFLKELQGSWYGEVPGLYKACVTFDALDSKKPWALQKIGYRLLEGDEPLTGTLTVSRNAYTGTDEPDYFLQAPEQAGAALIMTGSYQLMNAAKRRTDLRFSRSVSATEFGVAYTTAGGAQFSKKKNELTFARFDGDMYCFEDGVGSLCGTGGYRPFVLKRGTCPSF